MKNKRLNIKKMRKEDFYLKTPFSIDKVNQSIHNKRKQLQTARLIYEKYYSLNQSSKHFHSLKSYFKYIKEWIQILNDANWSKYNCLLLNNLTILAESTLTISRG